MTTSFHATVFSLIFHTPFYSFRLNDGHDGRYVNLLESLGCADRCIDIDSRIGNQPIDFGEVDIKMQELRAYSLTFLQTSLS